MRPPRNNLFHFSLIHQYLHFILSISVFFLLIRRLLHFTLSFSSFLTTSQTSIYENSAPKEQITVQVIRRSVIRVPSLLIKSPVHFKEISTISNTHPLPQSGTLILVFWNYGILFFRPSHNLETASNRRHIPTRWRPSYLWLLRPFAQRRRIPDCYSKRRHKSSYEVLKTNLIMFPQFLEAHATFFSTSRLSTFLSTMDDSESFISLRTFT